MRKIIAAFKDSRHWILLVFAVFFLSVSSIMRLALYVFAYNAAQATFSETLRIFLVGGLYDLTFYIYFAVFFSLLLLALPQVVYRSKFYKYLTFFFIFLFIYGTYFVVMAEWLFWDEFGVRFNFIAIDYLMYSYEVAHNISQSYPVAWLLSWIFLASAATFALLKQPIAKTLRIEEKIPARLFATGITISLALAAFFGIGQSMQHFSDNNYVNELSANGPYQFVAAFRNNTLDYKTFYVQGKAERLSQRLKVDEGKNPTSGGLFDITRDIKPTATARKLNVILISVESLSAEFFTTFGQREDITPFMDQWFKEGLLFTNFYATGTRTTRGLESITLSLPPTPGRSLVKRPDNCKIFNLGKVFTDHGYDVAFLYGGRGFFDNMNAFFAGNGYRTIDQTDINNEDISFENAWGVADEDLYRKAISEADIDYQAGRPFFFHLMTTSNHRPFTYPDDRIDIPSGSGRYGAVKYTDYAMKQLVDEAKKHKWFDDTVFVIVADHCASSAGRAELPINNYHIPLFIYSPKYIKGQTIAKLSGQIDIAPTLLALLNIKYESHFFGQNILSETFKERALIGNYQRLGVFADNKLAILAPVKQIVVINDPLHNEKSSPAGPEDDVVLEAMAFYQGADYILQNRLNRWQ